MFFFLVKKKAVLILDKIIQYLLVGKINGISDCTQKNVYLFKKNSMKVVIMVGVIKPYNLLKTFNGMP